MVRHESDPFRLRAVALALHAPEFLVACVASLALTVAFSALMLALVAPIAPWIVLDPWRRVPPLPLLGCNPSGRGALLECHSRRRLCSLA